MEDRLKKLERLSERRVIVESKIANALGEHKRQLAELLRLGKALTDSVLELNDRVKYLEGKGTGGQDVEVYIHRPKKDKLH